MGALEALERDFEMAEGEWEREKEGLTRGVRFADMSVSKVGDGEGEGEKRLKREVRGLAMQVEWLRARCKREEGLRGDAAWAKRFMLLQVELFGAWYVSLLPISHFTFPPSLPYGPS